MNTPFAKTSGVLKERENAHLFPGVYVTLEELIGLANAPGEIDLRARRRTQASMAGHHHSAFRGRGMDFDEVRAYNPGDDVRSIDWRVTARTGRPHTKVFREERERPVYLLVDQCQSMFFGSREAMKSVVAARLSAMLAWATREQGDRLGAIIFNDDHAHEVRPTEGKRGIQAFFRILIQFNQWLGADRTPSSPGKSPPLSEALQALTHVVKPGSLVFMISDFGQVDDTCLQQLRLLKRRADVIAFSIHDPLEKTLPPAGTYGFSNGIHHVRVDTSDKALRKRFSLRFLQHQTALKERLTSLAIPVIDIATDSALTTSLQEALGMRSRKGGA